MFAASRGTGLSGARAADRVRLGAAPWRGGREVPPSGGVAGKEARRAVWTAAVGVGRR